jgi:hypothetical protein
MKRVIEADKEGFQELLQGRRDEAKAASVHTGSTLRERARHLGITQGLDFAMHAVRDWVLPAGPPRLYGLTADEWFRLASMGQDSELAPCCGNIGELRDVVRELMTFQSEDDLGWRLSLGAHLLQVYAGDGNQDGDSEAGHGLGSKAGFPLLHKVLDGIRYEQEHKDERFDALMAPAPAPEGPPATS